MSYYKTNAPSPTEETQLRDEKLVKAAPHRPETTGSQAAARLASKYCHHGLVPAYCAHCKYGMPVDWR